MLGVVCLGSANGSEFVSRGCEEVQLVHHAGAGLVGGGHAGPHRVLQLQTLEVNPDLTNAGLTLEVQESHRCTKTNQQHILPL